MNASSAGAELRYNHDGAEKVVKKVLSIFYHYILNESKIKKTLKHQVLFKAFFIHQKISQIVVKKCIFLGHFFNYFFLQKVGGTH